jgi:hypothetical protein
MGTKIYWLIGTEVRASLMMYPRPLALLGSLALAMGCAGVKQNPGSGGGGSGGSTGKGGNGNSTGSGGTTPPPSNCNGACTDFPTTPVIDGSANSSTSAQIFGAAGSGNGSGGPCLFEPESGSLFPNNWLRPRFSWVASGAQNLFELRIHAGNQANDLVVYTTNSSWTLDKATWTNLAAHTEDTPITVTIRGASANGGTPSVGSASSFTIAPVGAQGNLVYWSPSGLTNGGMTVAGNTTLSGFAVGDDAVTQVLIPTDVSNWVTVDQGWNRRTAVGCIGCHTSTPDGDFIGFNDFYPWGGVLASGQAGALHGTPPTFINAGGYAAFTQPWVGIQTYSANHWATGDHVVVAPLGTSGNDTDQQPGLAWFDLESTTGALGPGQNSSATLKGTAWNWIYPPTSGSYAAAPSWSHQTGNDFVVFTGTSNVLSGRLGTGTAHLYKVPYSKTSAQSATPIPGDGSAAGFAQYYGTLSSDDNFIVYDRIAASAAAANHTAPNGSCSAPPCSWSGMYMQPAAELFLIPTAGGTATRLAANDPPKCPGQVVSPGINNTWAKWSPQVSTGPDGTVYHWLIFSSWRQGLTDPTTGSPIAQLFATAVTTNEIGLVTTYPAIYLWNQPANISNFTPAWDYFKIPIIIDQP